MVRLGEEKMLNWDGDLGMDAGSFYLTPQERIAQRDDQLVPLPPDKVKRRPKTKEDLIVEILEKDTALLAGGRDALQKKPLKPLQEIALKMNIEIKTSHSQIDKRME
mmetsp:Transcript_2599/g.4762  ORF Transcript_2599/g.4762 Transcript_2599/m.4762 type:complete len:107 (-) Transcript_2599:420-740(-)